MIGLSQRCDIHRADEATQGESTWNQPVNLGTLPRVATDVRCRLVWPAGAFAKREVYNDILQRTVVADAMLYFPSKVDIRDGDTVRNVTLKGKPVTASEFGMLRVMPRTGMAIREHTAVAVQAVRPTDEKQN